MVYKETCESQELYLYAMNDSNIFFKHFRPVADNMNRKIACGTYDRERAIDAFYHVATAASIKYDVDFGYSFNVQDRFTCACDMVETFESEYMERKGKIA